MKHQRPSIKPTGSRKPRVLIVYKRSNLDLYRHSVRTSAPPATLESVFGRAHKDHEASLLAAERVVEKFGMQPTWVRRDELRRFDEKQFDFGITIGGDGTLLSLATFVDDLPVLAVNSAPKDSIGFFAAANARTMERWVGRMLGGEKPQPVARLGVTLNGVTERPVLNDVLVTHPSPAATTRLVIGKGKREEEQKNSGVWIAAPAGATSAIGSAGGEPMNIADRKLQFLVREPYPRNHRYRLAKGFVAAKEKLTIEARLPELSVFLDGWTTVRTLRFGERVSFGIHPNSLWLYGRDERREKLVL